MKLELIGHDEKYALEQSLLTLFPGEKPVYGTVDKTADTRWARVTLTEEDERVQVTTELGVDGKSAAHSYDYPLSGTEYEKEGQRRHAVGISFFGAAKDLLGISPAWGSLTGVRPSKVALSLIREGGKKRAEKELQELYCVTPARARLAIEAADAGIVPADGTLFEPLNAVTLADAALYIRNALDIDSAEQAGLLSGDGATVLTKRDAALILQKVLRYTEKH